MRLFTVNVNQHFANIARDAADKGGNASEVLTKRREIFTKHIVPTLTKKGATDVQIRDAQLSWNSQTDKVMQNYGLLAKDGQSQRSFEKDKRAENAVKEATRTGSKMPIFKETLHSVADTIGNAFGQGTGSMIESVARFSNDHINDQEKNTRLDRLANYGADTRKGYENSASTYQKEAQAGQHGKAAQLGIGAIQSTPAMAMPFGVAKGVGTIASKVPLIASKAPYFALGAGTVAGHTQNYGEVRRGATQSLERDFPTWESLQNNPEYQKNYVGALDQGLSVDNARKTAHAKTLDDLSQRAADKYGTAMTAMEFIAPSGAVLGSGILKKAPDSLVAKALTGSVSTKLVGNQLKNQGTRFGISQLVDGASNKAMAKMVGRQFLEEGLQGGIGEYGSQAASANIGGKAVDYKQVGQSFIDEGIMGAVMGGGMQSASRDTPVHQAKEIAKGLRNQTNTLRSEEVKARQELATAMQHNNQEAIDSANANIANIQQAAVDLKQQYAQYGADVPHFLNTLSNDHAKANRPEYGESEREKNMRQNQFNETFKPNDAHDPIINTDAIDPELNPYNQFRQPTPNPIIDMGAFGDQNNEITPAQEPIKPSLTSIVDNHIQQNEPELSYFGMDFGQELAVQPSDTGSLSSFENTDPKQATETNSYNSKDATNTTTVNGITTTDEAPKTRRFPNQTQAKKHLKENNLKTTHKITETPNGAFIVEPIEDPAAAQAPFDLGMKVDNEQGIIKDSQAPIDLAIEQTQGLDIPQQSTQIETLATPSNFADQIRDAHVNNPSLKAKLINDEIASGRPRHEVLKEVSDIVSTFPKDVPPTDTNIVEPITKEKPTNVTPTETNPVDVDPPQETKNEPNLKPVKTFSKKSKADEYLRVNNLDENYYVEQNQDGLFDITPIDFAEWDKLADHDWRTMQQFDADPNQWIKIKKAVNSATSEPKQVNIGGMKGDLHSVPYYGRNRQIAGEIKKLNIKSPNGDIVSFSISTEDGSLGVEYETDTKSNPIGEQSFSSSNFVDSVKKALASSFSYNQEINVTPKAKALNDVAPTEQKQIEQNTTKNGEHKNTDIVRPDGQPFANKSAADLVLKKNKLADTHDVVKIAPSQFVVREKEDFSENPNDREKLPTDNTVIEENISNVENTPPNKPLKDQSTDNKTADEVEQKVQHNQSSKHTQKDNENVQQLDQTSGTTLERTPSEDVPRVRGKGDFEGETSGSSRADVSGSGQPRVAGDRSKPSVADGEREVSIPEGRTDSVNDGLDPKQAVTAQNTPVDAFIIDENEIAKGGKKTKYKANIEAIKVIKTLEAEKRPATREEQKTLSKFVGWGGLAEAFKREDGSISNGWTKEVAELESLLTKEELRAAVDSSIAAHYTSPEIVKSLWKAIENFGFKKGLVLEPSVGVGNFFGLMPKSMRKASTLHAVELDNITGAIAQNLYPEANIKAPMGFQDYQTIDNYFDIAIGNPPFSSMTITDKSRPEISGFSLHNYFFAKSIDSVKPNGVMAMVVTNRFMDKMGDKERSYIADRAELIGAIRLPNDAFLSNAGTQVTTDIIFLRKKAEGETTQGESWVDVKNYTDKDGGTVPLNEYFVRNPQNMIGDFGAYGSMYREGEPALIKREGQDTGKLLNELIESLPKDIFKAEESKNFNETRKAVIKDISDVKIGSKFIHSDGSIHERLPDVMGDYQSQAVEFASPKAESRVKGMIDIASNLAEVRTLQLDQTAKDNTIENARKKLNAVYDAFYAEHGYINSDSNKRLMRDDPNWAQLSSLENNYDRGVSAQVAKSTGQKFRKPSAEKAAIFTKRTQVPISHVESVSNVQDALTESLNRHGYIDIPTMTDLYGKNESEIISELGNLVYDNPINGYEVRDEYLSGNVKQKLAIAKEYAERDPKYERNVQALEKVIPATIEALDIDVKVGSHWIPANHIADFVNHISGSKGANVEYSKFSNKWDISKFASSASADATYSTDRANVKSILTHALNGTKPTIYDHFSNGSSQINQNATLEASQRVELVKQAWRDWIWESDARREHLEAIYNDTFNTTVNREYDGSHLKFHGMNSAIDLRPHQKNATWRSVQSKTTLFDHTVGAGKTFTVIASAMEMRRMGIANKPLIVVPNHLVTQWANDFVLLYPNANILAATKKDFEKGNRKKFIAKMANGDYDAIIIAHSSFGKISVSQEQEQAFIDKEIEELMAFEAELKSQNGDKTRNAKDIAKRRLTLEEKKKALSNRESKDTDNIFWHELGVDLIAVDEAHEFKNLEFTTSMQNVAGLGTGKGSQKAKDLFTKIQLMQTQNPKSKVIFATGTPISNTMAEMFTMQRYLDWDTLESKGINQFDAWAKTFGEVVSDWELSPAGKYKLTNRFAKFVNMPELMKDYLSFSDVMNRDDINAQLAKEGKTLGTPKIKGNKPQNIVVDRSDEQADFIGVPTVDEHGFEFYPDGSLVWRTENLPRKPEKGADNMLKIMGDARKAALDMRLVDPTAPDFEGSKINVSVNNIFDIYQKWNAKKGTQLVFCDLSTPKGAVAAEKARIELLLKKADDGDEAAQAELDKLSPDELSALDSDFSVYDDMKAKLIAKGMKESEVAFIHDAKTELQKQELFEKVKRGDIRVLIGSTAKMGAGMNVQNKLVALHHLDAPWRPSDLEQREGRIIRQGNEFYKADPNGFEIEINRYATKQTLDSRMWQTIESKANFIEQVRKGTGTAREVEDIAGEAANSAEMKAASSGDPRILEEIDLRKQIKELEDDRRNFDRSVHRTKGIVKSTENEASLYENKVKNLSLDAEIVQPEKFTYKNGKKTIHQEDKGARDEISKLFHSGVEQTLIKGSTQDIGTINGFRITSEPSKSIGYVNINITGRADPVRVTAFNIANDSVLGLVQKVLNQIKSIPEDLAHYREEFKNASEQLPALRKKLAGSKWNKTTELVELQAKHGALIEELKPKKKDQNPAQDDSSESNTPNDKKFSRKGEIDSTGSTIAQVEQILIDRFGKDTIQKLKDNGRLSIIPTFHEKGVEGVAVNGRVDLVADHLTPDTIIPTFLHEVGGHLGFQGLLSENAYKNLMEDFKRLVAQKDPIALKAKALAERESDSNAVMDEYLPYLITEAAKAKAKSSPVKLLLNRILSAVKAFLSKTTGVSFKLNSSDILALSERMINQVAKTKPAKTIGKEISRNSGISNQVDDIVSLWQTLAKNNEAFQLATSDKKSLLDVFADLEPELEPILFPKSSAEAYGAEKSWRVKMKPKGTAVILEKGNTVWVDVSLLKEGGDGKRIYNAVANYAYNNNKVFIGDPSGLSEAAMTRRLENMLSSALKFGTTKHLYPQAQQEEGNALVPAINWKQGDDRHNLKQMIMASYEATKTLYPEIEKISYNPEKDSFIGEISGRFRLGGNEPGAISRSGGKNREFTRLDFQRLASLSRAMPIKRGDEFASSSGSTSIERAILTRTFLQSESREVRARILDRIGNVGSQRLTGAHAVLYSKNETPKRYSRIDPANPQDLPRSRQREFFERASQSTTGQAALHAMEASKTFSNRTVKLFNTMMHKALSDETGDFKKTFDLVQDKINHVTFASSVSMDAAPSVLTQLETWGDFAKEGKRVGEKLTGKTAKVDKDLAKVSQLMFENTLSEDSEVHTDKELRQLGFDEDQVSLYNEIRNAVDTSLDTFAKTTISNIYKHLAGSNEEVLELLGQDLELHQHVNEIQKLIDQKTKNDPDKADARKLAIESIDKVVSKLQSLKDAGYIPLMRFGKYYARVVNPTTGEVAYRQHFESESERNRFFDTYDQSKIQVGFKLEKGQINELQHKLFQGVSPETVALFAKEANLPIGDAESAYIKMAIRDNHALKRLLKRQGIDGFDTDIKRVLASFVLSNARYSANQTYNPAIDESIQNIKDPAYAEDAIRLRDYALDTQEELAGIKNFAFVWYMGFSVMFGVVNMTQPLIQTLPYLLQYSKDWKVTGRAFTKALKTWKNGAESIPDKYKAVYEKAKRHGHLDPQNTWMLQGMERGKSGLGASGWQLFSHASGFFAQASETINRRTTLFAALDVAENLGQTKLEQLGFKDAYDFAVRTIQETQGIYNKGNRPRLARGNIGSMLMMYKQFMIAYIEQMVRMQKRGLWGGEDDEFKRKMAQLVGFGISKPLLIMMGLLMSFSGATGLPFIRDLLDVVETTGGMVGKPFNTEREVQMALNSALGDTIGTAANTMLMDGVFNLNPVVDFKGRMGMGDLVPATAYFSPLTSEYGKNNEGSQVFGAMGGLADKVKEAVAFAQIGQYMQAGTQLLPKAGTSLLQGGNAAITGDYRNMKTGVKTNDATILDGVVKVLDGQPADIAKQGRYRGLEMKDGAALAYVNKNWKERYKDALESGDAERIKEINDQIAEYNADNPRYPITFNKKTVEKSFKKDNQNWRDKRKTKKGLEWMDEQNPYI